MMSTGTPQSLRDIYLYQPNGAAAGTQLTEVVQDKVWTSSIRLPSPQPVPVTNSPRTEASGEPAPQTHQRPDAAGQRLQIGVWVKPRVREEIERRAKTEGLSLSAVSAALIESALQHSLSATYAPLLEPVIKHTITTAMRGIATRLSWLLVRVAFDAGQTRSLVTNILGRQPGVTEDLLKTILSMSQKTAKGNIIRKTPQLASLIDAVEQWLVEPPAA